MAKLWQEIFSEWRMNDLTGKKGRYEQDKVETNSPFTWEVQVALGQPHGSLCCFLSTCYTQPYSDSFFLFFSLF